MNHLSQLQLSMYADGALGAEDVTEIRAHLDNCDSCQAHWSAAQQETRVLTGTIKEAVEKEEVETEFAIPKFKRPISLRGFAMANIATGLTIWLAQFLWKTLFGELVMNAAARITSIYIPDAYEITNTALLYFLEEGTAMFDTYQAYVLVCLMTVTLLGATLVFRKSRAAMGACLMFVTAGALIAPEPANALDIRSSKSVLTISASEVIDDTLILAAETVRIEGRVTGDVVAVGQSIDVTGSIDGNLIVFAESVDIQGTVGGTTLGGASSFTLDGATIGSNVWVGAERIELDRDTKVSSNATLASRTVSVDGQVGKDLYGFSELLEVTGSVGNNLEAFANRIRLLGDAHVSGDVRWRSGNPDGLHQDDSVQVDGEVEFLPLPEALKQKNKFATLQFYLWEFAGLISAFLVGLALLWLAPSLRTLAIGSGIESVKTAGVGLLALVSAPIIAVIIAITLVGLPFTFAIFVAWLMGIYLAKIVIGVIVGGMIFGDNENLPLTLIAGLTAVAVAINVPFIGGILSAILTILGLGLIVQHTMNNLSAD
jgi:predicted anti-sigma-YlaC factor YlaD